MIHVIASISTTPGNRQKYLDVLETFLENIRSENGCIEYGPVSELDLRHPAQSLSGDETVTILERWSNEAALRAHFEAPHMHEYRSRIRDLVDSVRLQVFRS